MRLLLLAIFFSVAFSCNYNAKQYKNGEEWVENNAFRMRCRTESNGSWQVAVAACITADGLEIPANQTRSTGEYEWECKVSPGGYAVLKQGMGRTADCLGGHTHGTEWTEKSFRFRCEDGGIIRFLGCIGREGTFIPEGQSRAIGGLDVECKKFANGTVTMGAIPRQDGSCRDSQGITRRNGEIWTESEHFVKQCKNNVPTVIGCRVPQLANHIPLNGTFTRGQVEYFCDGNSDSFRFYSKVKSPATL